MGLDVGLRGEGLHLVPQEFSFLVMSQLKFMRVSASWLLLVANDGSTNTSRKAAFANRDSTRD